MAFGHADWRPPGAGGGSRKYVFVQPGAFPSDIIASPGAGFRLVLYWLGVWHDATGSTFELWEETSANAQVARLYRANGTTNLFHFVDLGGVPLAANNKVRNELVAGWKVAITYIIEPI
jgi:hypothetical protein